MSPLASSARTSRVGLTPVQPVSSHCTANLAQLNTPPCRRSPRRIPAFVPADSSTQHLTTTEIPLQSPALLAANTISATIATWSAIPPLFTSCCISASPYEPLWLAAALAPTSQLTATCSDLHQVACNWLASAVIRRRAAGANSTPTSPPQPATTSANRLQRCVAHRPQRRQACTLLNTTHHAAL